MAWNGSDRVEEMKKKGGDNDRPQWGGRHGWWGGRHWWIAIGAIAVLAGAIWLIAGTGGGTEDAGGVKPAIKLTQHSARDRSRSPRQAVADAMKDVTVKSGKKRERKIVNIELFSHLSGEDRKMAESVQAALDEGDWKKTLTAAEYSLTSTNAEVRLNALDALSWFGAAALPEITVCMADADEDVRQSAENHFEIALQDVEKPAERLKVALAAFATLSDEDQLTSLGGIIDGAATELIDGEEDGGKASEYRVTVIQELVYIIDEGRASNVKAAQELYNDITGNEWLGIEEAERYLSDPENYMPPDENAEEAVPAETSVEETAETSVEETAETTAEEVSEKITEPAEEGQSDQSEEAAEESQAETQEEKSGETEEEDQSEAVE